jgi:hypothetical protein
MFAFRSLALGLLGACLMLLARGPQCEVRLVPSPVVTRVPAPPPASIVDVAPGIAGNQLGALVHLAPGEHVIAVGEREVAGDLEAGAVLAEASPRSGSYIDLTVASATGPRRMLVLMH